MTKSHCLNSWGLGGAVRVLVVVTGAELPEALKILNFKVLESSQKTPSFGVFLLSVSDKISKTLIITCQSVLH